MKALTALIDELDAELKPHLQLRPQWRDNNVGLLELWYDDADPAQRAAFEMGILAVHLVQAKT